MTVSSPSAGTASSPATEREPVGTVADAVAAPSHAPLLLATFVLTTFLSASLLFSIQPIFAKMVLPVLGGAPSVWAVALMFFQGALLAGYAYAHLLIRLVPLRSTGFVHALVFIAAALALPIGLPASLGEPPAGDPTMWQLQLFAIGIGLPFLAVAANAPLLQAWYAASGAPDARDPYFLYGASNLGSLLALLGYPFLLEPVLGLTQLSWYWTLGYGVLLLALMACFFMLRGRAAIAGAGVAVAPSPAPSRAPAIWDRFAWIGLAMVPAALLTAFTTHIATDIASAPLIWVIPLALYLLTFVLVFRERSLVPRWLLLPAHLASVVVALVVMAQIKSSGWFLMSGAGLAAFLTTAMVAHRTLYEQRPDASRLTEFYLLMSLGGVLGGLFSALLAPRIFSEVLEYPLLIALGVLCRPGALDWRRWNRSLPQLALVLGLAWAATLVAPWGAAQLGNGFWGYGTTAAIVAALGLVMVVSWRHPPLVAGLALAMFTIVGTRSSQVHHGQAWRSYFGVYRVMTSEDRDYRILRHGTTLHGAQRIRDADGNEVDDLTPATYYHPESPMARSLDTLRTVASAAGRKARVGVVGLGTGSLACHSKPGETWRYFEIDPLMVEISLILGGFTFLGQCLPNPDIVLGDARLTLAKEEPAAFDMLIVDAFSSDAVPVHLMTAEAMSLYLSRVSDTGAVVLHISNRYLDLNGVVGATAAKVPGAHAILIDDDESDGSYASSRSTIAVLAKSEAALAPFRGIEGAQEIAAKGQRAWTDDASDILTPFLAKGAKW